MTALLEYCTLHKLYYEKEIKIDLHSAWKETYAILQHFFIIQVICAHGNNHYAK